MKIQVITRAFFEDAYIEFFIKYYLALGFDRIVILKADDKNIDYLIEKILGEKNIFTSENSENKQQILVKYVKNEGNGIYTNPENFHLFNDKEYDWTLHIDADEFLIFNMEKYKSIHEYVISLHKEMNMEKIEQIRFRWLCINKLNNNWDLITNFNAEKSSLLMDTNCETTKKNIEENKNSYSMYNYLLGNKIESYKFIKSMIHKDYMMNDPEAINAHFFKMEPDHKSIIDNRIMSKNTFQQGLYIKNNTDSNYCNGFILHFNTRSYANSVTKCLVTQLRRNKQITDLDDFRNFLNTYNHCISDINGCGTDGTDNTNSIKIQFINYLNSKKFFPNKIKNYHKKWNHLLTNNQYLLDLNSVTKELKNLVFNENFINIETEYSQLKEICAEKELNYEKLKYILELFK